MNAYQQKEGALMNLVLFIRNIGGKRRRASSVFSPPIEQSSISAPKGVDERIRSFRQKHFAE